MALGVAVALVGVGIGAAAFGASYLVEAFKGMGGESIAAVAGILAFGGALYFATPAIAAAGTAGYVAAIPLLALGAAFLMAGVGVGFMAQGLAMLVESFVQLAPHLLEMALFSPIVALGLYAMASGFSALALSMLPFLNPIAIFGLSLFTANLFGIAKALSQIGTSASALNSLEKIITVSTSVNSDELDNLKAVMSQVRLTMASSTTADREALKAMAQAIGNMGSGGAGGRVPIKLIVNDRVFAETVIDLYDKGTAAAGIS